MTVTDQFYPQGPFGAYFWGGYWAPNPAIVLLDVTGECSLDAEPQGYGSIRLSWTQVKLDFDRWLLVRNNYGYPDTPADGTVVLMGFKDETVVYNDSDGNIYNGGFNVTEFLDGLLEPGFHYYTMFVGLNQ